VAAIAENFIEVPIETDADTLADNAIDVLQAQWEDWEPNEGDLEVVQIEALSQMAADVADVAAIMPNAAFEAILERLFNVVPQDGTPATGAVTFNLVDTTANLIPAGTEVDIDGFAFSVDDDTPTVAGSATVVGVPVTANDNDTDANGLTGETVTLVGVLAFVSDVSLVGTTSGAVDPETEQEYLDRGSQALELQAITLVTAHDYEIMAQSDPRVGRAVATDDRTNRRITVTASQADGSVIDAATKTSLAALFDSYRQTTWQVVLGDATNTTINVTFQIHVYPSFDAPTVISAAADAVTVFLDPTTWGSNLSTPSPTPDVEPRVRKNKLIDVIGSVTGVDYVIDLTITGSAGSVQSNGDWLMPGIVPIPSPGTITGTAA
jgi:hypothetical protein